MIHTFTSLQAGQFPMDRSWFLHMNAFAQSTPWLHGPLRLYAHDGVAVFAVLLVWSWWVARGADDLRAVAAAVWAPLGALLALGLNQPLVHLVAEPRPYTVLPHVLVLVARSSDPAFPSDHAVMAGAVTAGVLLVSRRWGFITLAAALVMCAARVYVGVHFPGDVLVGLVLGALVSLGGYRLLGRVLESLVAAVDRSPLWRLVSSRSASHGAVEPDAFAEPR